MTSPARLLRAASPVATDGDLLARYARHRDEAAFAELVRRNGPVVLRACRSVLGESAAEDAFQATFLILVRKAPGLTCSETLAGWLHATAVRVARDARRADLRARRREVARTAPRTAPADDLTWREVRAAIDAELAVLPEVYRVPLVLCYLQELSYEEAAARAGCSVGALRGRLERGREQLRRRLARYGLPATVPALVAGGPTPAPAALVEATLYTVRTAAAGGPLMGAVASLARPRTRAWGRLAPVAVTLLAVGAVLAGAGQPSATDPPPSPAHAAADPPAPRVDRFGDPLPDGVVMRLGTTRARATIAGFGISPDGAVVSVTPNGDISVWPARGERPVAAAGIPVAASGRFVPRAAVSPDGRYVAANTPGGTVAVWERRDAGLKEVASFAVPYSSFLRFSPDGSKLAAVGPGLHLCDLGTKEVHGFEGLMGGTEAGAFSGDGKRLAATSGYEAALWDTTDGTQLARYKTGTLRYSGIALDRTGGVMAVSPTWEPKTVVFVDPTTGRRLDGPSGPGDFHCLWANFAPDGRTILLGGRPGDVLWWDPAAGKTLQRFEGMAHNWGGGQNLPARFSPDGKTVVGTSARMLLRWDAATGQPLLPESHDGGHHADLTAVGVSADGRWVATGGYDTRVRVWDAGTGRPVATVPADWMLATHNVELSTDGRFVYAPSPTGGGVTKWEVAAGRAVVRFGYTDDPAGRADLVAYRLAPDGRTLDALANPTSTDKPVLRARWDAASGKLLAQEPVGRRTVRSTIAFSPDGRWFETDTALYPVEVGPAGSRLPREAYSLFGSGAFSADSRLIGRVLYTNPRKEIAWRVGVFEVTTGARVADAPLGSSGQIALHPDGRSVAVAGPKGLTFHDLATGRVFAERKVEPGADRPTRSFAQVVRYFPDGKKLVTGHTDTTALIWDVPARPKTTRSLDGPGRAAAWNDLASSDGVKGWAAVWALADDPGTADFLRPKLRPVEVAPAAEFDRLLADLGSADYATREAAERALRQAGERAAGRLRSARAGDLSAEQRGRVDRLLGVAAGAASRPQDGDQLRAVRAVAALELAGTAEARQLLGELAAGAADALVTREAQAARDRAVEPRRP
jgi:RNA polymerase sigma factor (sigma-70 family)